MRNGMSVFVLALLPVTVVSGAHAPVVAERTSSEAVTATTGPSSHVIVVSLDGLRPDAIERFNAKTLKRLMREGSYSLEATTILPSKTLPSHTSMLTGTEPESHGVTWNSEEMDDHGHVATPTIFALAKGAGYHTAAFFSKSKFEHLAVPGSLDHVRVPKGLIGFRPATETVSDATGYLRRNKPNLLFVHLGEPDFLGHRFGWMSAPYGWAVKVADREVANLLAAADRAFGPDGYTVLVTADHGGHGKDHGSDDPRDVTIPWIAWGKGVRGGTVLQPGIRTMDTAATALWLLGVEAPELEPGRPVAAAFDAASTPILAGSN